MSFIGQPVAAGINYAAQSETNSTNLNIARETNMANERIARQTNEANRKLAEQQNQWNIEQWQRVNRYNDPSAQGQRLRNAGLSAAAAASAVNGGEAGSLQSADLANQQVGAPAQSAHMEAPDFSMLSGMNLIAAARELEALKHDKMTNEEQSVRTSHATEFVMSELDARTAANQMTLQTISQREKENPYKLEAWKQGNSLQQEEIENKKLQNQQARLNYDKTKQEFDFLAKMNDEQLKKVQAEISNIQKQGSQIEAQTKNIQQDTANKVLEGEHTKATTENIKEQKEGITSENRLKRLEVILKEAGAPESVTQRIAALVSSGDVTFESVADNLPVIKRYINEGYRAFGTDPNCARFLSYIFDEGKGQSNKLGAHTAGAARDAADDFINMFK